MVAIRSLHYKKYQARVNTHLSIHQLVLKLQQVQLELAFFLLTRSFSLSYPCQVEVLVQGVLAVLVDPE